MGTDGHDGVALFRLADAGILDSCHDFPYLDVLNYYDNTSEFLALIKIY